LQSSIILFTPPFFPLSCRDACAGNAVERRAASSAPKRTLTPKAWSLAGEADVPKKPSSSSRWQVAALNQSFQDDEEDDDEGEGGQHFGET
jgi:hypothetical protein